MGVGWDGCEMAGLGGTAICTCFGICWPKLCVAVPGEGVIDAGVVGFDVAGLSAGTKVATGAALSGMLSNFKISSLVYGSCHANSNSAYSRLYPL